MLFLRQAAQGDTQLPAPGGAAGGGGSTKVYRDAEDAATIPEGNDLKVSAKATCLNFLVESNYRRTCKPSTLPTPFPNSICLLAPVSTDHSERRIAGPSACQAGIWRASAVGAWPRSHCNA